MYFKFMTSRFLPSTLVTTDNGLQLWGMFNALWIQRWTKKASLGIG